MRLVFFALALSLSSAHHLFADSPDEKQTLAAIEKAVTFFRNEYGYQGAYGYRASADLSQKEGEGKMRETSGWIEPPATPFVGRMYLDAYLLTGESILLDAALEVANALRKSQLVSGGWAGNFELGEGRKNYRYRIEDAGEKKKNHSTLDDNKTQSCLMFLMALDQALEFKNKEVKNVLDYAFEKIFDVQYPNGAWPQQYSGPVTDPEDFPVTKAKYPESWPREFPKKDYRGYYTLNDGTITDMLDVMLTAHQIYGDDKFLKSATKTADFLLLAQLPQPQPGWAQQYSREMEPVWARKFEPPSLTGSESQEVMKMLLMVYRATRDRKYLEPIPDAIAYYRSCLLPDGKLARFYELKTNKPLFFTKEYELTYSADDLPTHYGFIVGSKLDWLEGEYQKLSERDPADVKPYTRRVKTYKLTKGLAKEAAECIEAMDERGAWVESGDLKNWKNESGKVIDSKTFAKNLLTLSGYLSALRQ